MLPGWTCYTLLYAVGVRADVEASVSDAKAGRVVDVSQLRRDYGLTRCIDT
jgi:hypothetical protein